ncbi:uncharacterized protein LOC119169283 [Rhipicephalus microplus]|uniref:uncharacterized protein LOC119169283 n=1 Tax=Rhipicephalus microplus TaxID=6941 RepID=UPI003F6CB7A2
MKVAAWLCQYCDYPCPTKHHLVLHEARHSDEHKDRIDRQLAWRHSGMVVRWNPERSFRCTLCGRGFNQKMNLARHMQRHTGEKPHQCHLCSKRFNQKCNLERHIRSHTGERPFHCTFCPKSFNSKSNLNRHVACHEVCTPKMTVIGNTTEMVIVPDFNV